MATNSQTMIANWQDPTFRERMLQLRRQSETYTSPDRGRRIAEKAKERWQDDGFRDRMSEALKAGRQNNPTARYLPVVVDGVHYISVTHAVRATGLPRLELKALALSQRAQK